MGNLPQMRAKCLVKIENTWQYLQSPPGPRLYFWGPKSPNPASDQIQKANPTHLLLMQRKQKVISYASLRHYSCLKATRHSQNHRTTSSQEDETPNFIKTCIPLTITIHSGISKNLVHEFQPSIFRAERKQIGLLLFGIVKAQMKSFWQSSSRSELYVPCPSSRPSYDRVMKMVSDGRIPRPTACMKTWFVSFVWIHTTSESRVKHFSFSQPASLVLAGQSPLDAKAPSVSGKYHS